MPKIFICYRREDTDHAAARVYEQLSEHFGSQNVFIDVDSIQAGEDYHEVLRGAVMQCDCLIAVIGHRWLEVTDETGRRRIDRQDDWVRTELEAALEKKIRTVPLLVSPASMPSEVELPSSLKRLSRLQAQHLGSWHTFKSDVAQLVQQLEHVPARATPSQPAAESGRSQPPAERPLAATQLRSTLSTSFDTPFVGRQAEIEEVTELITRDEARIVTITGPGGVGKTRFASEVAKHLTEHFVGSVVFVDMTKQESLTGVSNAVAEALGNRLEAADEPNVLVANILEGLPPSLLVLDNFEQIVEHAEATVNLWSSRAPETCFLVTSRILLQLEDEAPVMLESFPVPSPEAPDFAERLAENEAVRLFVGRAARKKRGFKLTPANTQYVARICQRLEGHPLSLVLVAEQIKMTPKILARKLDDKFSLVSARGKRLWDTIDWSYQLLSESEKEVFLQACIFSDSFSLESAEDVIEPAADADAFEILQSLCDHSLVMSLEIEDDLRFRLYQAIQEFGQAKLAEASHADLLAATASCWSDYFIRYAERWSRKIYTPECSEALEALVLERENVLGVNQWALANGQPIVAARAILAYAEALKIRGPASLRVPRLEATLELLGEGEPELRARLLTELLDAEWARGRWDLAAAHGEAAIALAESLGQNAILATALGRTANLERSRGYHAQALRHFERSSEIFAELGDAAGIAHNAAGAGAVLDLLADYDAAIESFGRARKTFERVRDPIHLARCLNYEGLVLYHRGDTEPAEQNFIEAERINRSLGDTRWVAGNLTNRGLVLVDMGRIEDAMACYEEAKGLHASVGNKAWSAVNEGVAGAAFLRGKDYAQALPRFQKAIAMYIEVGYRQDLPYHAGNCGRAFIGLNRLTEAREQLERSIAGFQEIEETGHRRYMGSLICLAKIEMEQGNVDAARALATEAEALRERLSLTESHRVGQIREDLALLREVSEWLASA